MKEEYSKRELVQILQQLYRLRDEGKRVRSLVRVIEDRLVGKIQEEIDKMEREG